MGKLDKQVIVLNKSWQPIRVITVQQALSMMAADAATAMDLSVQGYLVPVRWKDWLELSVTDQDDGIRTPSRVVRAPRVIIACPSVACMLRKSGPLSKRYQRSLRK